MRLRGRVTKGKLVNVNHKWYTLTFKKIQIDNMKIPTSKQKKQQLGNNNNHCGFCLTILKSSKS